METNTPQQETSIADLFVHPGPADPGAQQTPPAQPTVDPVTGAPPAPVPPAPVAPPVHMVPLPELLDARHRAQAAEIKAQQVADQMAAFQRSFYEAQRPQPQPIDPVADPEGAFNAIAQQLHANKQMLQEQAVHQRANMSEMLAKKDFGAPAVEAARDAAVKAGLGNYFLTQADPYQAVMEWHRGQTAAKEIGDPAAYREKIKAEILAELRGQAPALPVKPGTPPVLPPSLSNATRASSTGPVVQDANDFFRSMMAKRPAG